MHAATVDIVLTVPQAQSVQIDLCVTFVVGSRDFDRNVKDKNQISAGATVSKPVVFSMSMPLCNTHTLE